jgi:phosphoglycerate dehydrogenase-like enzyme
MTPLADDAFELPPTDGVAAVWPLHDLDRMLAESDVVAVCCPLTPETRNLLDDAAFSRMKRGAYVVNVTRGEIIDGEALVAALKDGRCGGAALDVAPGEPLPSDHPLFTLPNVAMTPHTAGASQLRAPRNIARFCENLRRARQRQPLLGIVDKQLGY